MVCLRFSLHHTLDTDDLFQLNPSYKDQVLKLYTCCEKSLIACARVCLRVFACACALLRVLACVCNLHALALYRTSTLTIDISMILTNRSEGADSMLRSSSRSIVFQLGLGKDFFYSPVSVKNNGSKQLFKLAGIYNLIIWAAIFIT